MQPLDLSRRDLLRAAGAVVLAYPFRGFVEGALMAAESPSKTQTDNLALRFAKYYKPVKVETKPSIPAYELPLDLNKVANFKDVAGALDLSAEEPSLKKNGFAVLPGKGNEDVVEPYKHLRKLGVPLFITADTLLHLYHVQFDETLKDIEEREFYKDVVALTETMVAEARSVQDDGRRCRLSGGAYQGADVLHHRPQGPEARRGDSAGRGREGRGRSAGAR